MVQKYILDASDESGFLKDNDVIVLFIKKTTIK